MAIEADTYKVNKEQVAKVVKMTQQLGCAVRILEKRVLELNDINTFVDDGYDEPMNRLYTAMRRVEEMTAAICDGDDGAWIGLSDLREDLTEEDYNASSQDS